MKVLRFGKGLAALLMLAAATSASAKSATGGRRPLVVELFTAQGCSACPQANALLQELAGRKDVLALTFPVDVWDYLGWADTLAQPAFAARQKAYAARFKLREIYTPEMVVDGRREALGFDRNKVQALIDAARGSAKPASPPVRSVSRSAISLGASPSSGAVDLWLARYDPTERTVKVTAGENKGKTVVQQNVVRQLVRLGSWSGRARRYALPPPTSEGLTGVVLMQGARAGPMLATVKL